MASTNPPSATALPADSTSSEAVSAAQQNGKRGITEIPEIAYVQEEFGAWLKYFLERNAVDIDAAQSRAIDIIVDEFADKCYALLNKHLFPNAINRYTMQDLKEFYIPKIREQFTQDPSSVAVILDQAIYYMVREELGADFGGRIHELSMGRPHGNLCTSEAGGKVPRVGYASLSEQVKQLKERIGDGGAFFIDDTTVEGGTFRAAQALLEEGGIRMLPPENNIVYFLTLREETGMKRPPPPYKYCVKMTNSRGSIELRECSVFGGAQEQTWDENRKGMVVPAFPPFSDGAALRMSRNGVATLNLTEAADELVSVNREFVKDLAGILGEDPESITLDRFNLVPADPAVDGVRSFMRKACGRVLGRSLGDHEQPEEVLGKIPLLAYLDAAHRENAETPHMNIDVVCVDTDGTMAEMKPVDPELAEIGGPLLFRETQLGFHVWLKTARAARLLLKHNQLATVSKLSSENLEQVLQLFYRWGLDEEAEKKFGEEAKQRVRDICIAAYGKGRGLVEAERFLDSMPLRYHAIRHLTWDLPLDKIYQPNDRAKQFAENIHRRGGKLVFVTASPRIHALKLLTELGVMQNPGPNHFELYTVEDLYDPETVPRRTNPNPAELFVERDKSVILHMLHTEKGIPKERICMAGDVFATEVRPALFNGYPARIVKNPDQLEHYARSIALPGDAEIDPNERLKEFGSEPTAV